MDDLSRQIQNACLSSVVFLQRVLSDDRAVRVHDGHVPVRKIRSGHEHAICPKLAGDLPGAFAGRLDIREIKPVFGKSDRIGGKFDFELWHAGGANAALPIKVASNPGRVSGTNVWPYPE